MARADRSALLASIVLAAVSSVAVGTLFLASFSTLLPAVTGGAPRSPGQVSAGGHRRTGPDVLVPRRPLVAQPSGQVTTPQVTTPQAKPESVPVAVVALTKRPSSVLPTAPPVKPVKPVKPTPHPISPVVAPPAPTVLPEPKPSTTSTPAPSQLPSPAAASTAAPVPQLPAKLTPVLLVFAQAPAQAAAPTSTPGVLPTAPDVQPSPTVTAPALPRVVVTPPTVPPPVEKRKRFEWKRGLYPPPRWDAYPERDEPGDPPETHESADDHQGDTEDIGNGVEASAHPIEAPVPSPEPSRSPEPAAPPQPIAEQEADEQPAPAADSHAADNDDHSQPGDAGDNGSHEAEPES